MGCIKKEISAIYQGKLNVKKECISNPRKVKNNTQKKNQYSKIRQSKRSIFSVLLPHIFLKNIALRDRNKLAL